MKPFSLIIFFTLFTNCAPVYRVYYFNPYSENTFLKTDPPLEYGYIKESDIYTYLVSIKTDSINNIYRINSKDSIYLYSAVLGATRYPSFFFPYKFVEIIKEKDTLRLTRNNINDYIKRTQNKRIYHIKLNFIDK